VTAAKAIAVSPSSPSLSSELQPLSRPRSVFMPLVAAPPPKDDSKPAAPQPKEFDPPAQMGTRRTPTQERTRMLRELEDSGVGYAAWNGALTAAVSGWKLSPPREFDHKLTFGEVHCYQRGCTFDLGLSDVDAGKFDEWMMQQPVFREWNAAKGHSGPVIEGESASVTWFFYAPIVEQQ